MDPRNVDNQKNIFGVEKIDVFLMIKNSSSLSRKNRFRLNKFDNLSFIKQTLQKKYFPEASGVNIMTRGKLLRGEFRLINEFKIQSGQVRLKYLLCFKEIVPV